HPDAVTPPPAGEDEQRSGRLRRGRGGCDAEAQEEQRSKCGGPAHELCLDRERLGPEPLGVLLLVVAAGLAGLDRLPPGAVRRVPLDRLGQPALAEGVARRPAERAELPVVERVAAVVPSTILDV